MANRSLELTIISAKGLNKVNLVGKMDLYAVVYISGPANQDQKQKTHVDVDGHANPTWNYTMKFQIDESATLQNRLTLVVKIKTEGLFGDKDVGELHVPIKELLEESVKMMTILILLVTMMADVSSRYHGGDGDDDGRYPDGRPRIDSQCEGSNITKGRGKNANKNLEKAFKKNKGRPLPLFYTNVGDTYKIVGDNASMFVRKVSTEVVERAEFHYPSWDRVPDNVKNAIYSTLQHYFDLQSLQCSDDWPAIKAGIDFECARAYRDRKYDMHRWFNKNGGLNDLQTSRSNPPDNMDVQKWHTVIDTLWSTPKHIRQSEENAKNRAKHRYSSSHGSSSYAQQLYTRRNDPTVQENVGPIQIWYDNHFNQNQNDAAFVEDWRRIEQMRDLMRANEAIEDGQIDEVECLRRALGTRRGFQPGVGRQVRYNAPDMGSYSSTQRTPTNQEDDEERINQIVSQQLSQAQTQMNQQMQRYMEQMRRMNPGFNFPQMPFPPPEDDE